MHKPLLSIVIANYNYGRFLEDAIQSVITQNIGDEIELIICDGASTDNSVQVIKKYACGLPPNTHRLEWQDHSKLQINESYSSNRNSLTYCSTLISWWCSEKDQGQADAFNKGFSHARGRYGCWLNADDIFANGALTRVCNYLRKHKDVEWLGGSSMFVDSNLQVLWCSRCVRVPSWWVKRIPYYSVNGPSSFFLIERFKQAGGFDVKLRYSMDTDLWRRFTMCNMRLCYIRGYVWAFRVHEQSKTSHKFISGVRENNFSKECSIVDGRYGISPRCARFASKVNRLFRFILFSYASSWFDTVRYKGRSVKMISCN